MTYTINPNAKNVWIRDNEDTMDLSPITDASSVYLENGRTIEQELGEGSMVSNIATVDTSMSKIIDGALDGAYESCVLKGRTLVNLATEKNMASDYSIRFIGRQITGKVIILNAKKSDSCYFNLWSINEQRYTKHVNINSDTLVYEIPSGQYIYNIYDTTITSGEGNLLLFSDIMIIEYQEGMENWDIPYFEGICDVKMPILRNVGKNLANQSKYEIEAYVGGSDGVTVAIGSAAKNTQSIIMEIEPDVSIVASSSSNSDRKVLACFNHFPTNGSKATKKTNNGYITTDTDTKYVMYYYNSDTVANGIVSQVQIEESSSATSYEPYKTNILHTPEEIVLRSLPSGVKDTYNVITGEYVKRIGEVVLDGSESWILNVNDDTRCNCYCNGFNTKPSQTVVNDKLPSNINHTNENRIVTSTVGGFAINLLKNTYQSVTDLKTFKEWLSQNPITVQYELATPVTKTVSPVGIPFAYENGHVILESGYEGQSLLPTLEYSTVVNKTGQVQSVAKTIMKQEEQLSSLEKMLVQSIIEMDYNNTLLTLNLEIDEVM